MGALTDAELQEMQSETNAVAELQAAGPESMVKALALIATAERTGNPSGLQAG